jgi:hypothetical protein
MIRRTEQTRLESRGRAGVQLTRHEIIQEKCQQPGDSLRRSRDPSCFSPIGAYSNEFAFPALAKWHFHKRMNELGHAQAGVGLPQQYSQTVQVLDATAH